MKITREEFKGLVGALKEQREFYDEMEPYFSEEVMNGLYTVIGWIETALHMDMASINGWDCLWDLAGGKSLPVKWDMIQIGENEYDMVNVVRSSDLDEVYDTYLADEE